MSKIVAVRKEGVEIMEYQLDNGEIIDKATAVQMTKDGEIEDVFVSNRDGHEYIKSSQDGDEENNLQNLPEIE